MRELLDEVLSAAIVFLVVWGQSDDVGWGVAAVIIYMVMIVQIYQALERDRKENE